MALTATYDVIDSAGVSSILEGLLLGLCKQALKEWGDKLAGDADLVIRLEIIDGLPDLFLADAGPASGAVVGTDGDTEYWVSTLALKLQGNVVKNPDNEPDIVIRVNADSLGDVFLDPSPETRGPIPASKYDGFSILLHELGHGLGFYGFYDDATGVFQDNTKSAFDYRVLAGDPYASFIGPNARSILTAVPITTGNYGHYGNNPGDPNEGNILLGLMGGLGAYPGYAYQISPLDIAMLADTGLGTNGDDVLDLPFLPSMRGGAGNDTISGGETGNRLMGESGADVLTGNGGNDTLLGGTERDYLTGGAGNDMLDGGTGIDIMSGGAGNDTYIVDHVRDIIYETDSSTGFVVDAGGKDTVRSSVSADLTVYGSQFVENLVLTGARAVNVRGNDLANRLTGNSANNTLSGGDGADILMGGAGNDRLVGGTGRDQLAGGFGADSFVFNVRPSKDNAADVIRDFRSDQSDQIELVARLFPRIGHLGSLLSDEFHADRGATNGHDASDRIIYNSGTGNLYYDPDGSGAQASILLAQLKGAPALAADDIVLIA